MAAAAVGEHEVARNAFFLAADCRHCDRRQFNRPARRRSLWLRDAAFAVRHIVQPSAHIDRVCLEVNVTASQGQQLTFSGLRQERNDPQCLEPIVRGRVDKPTELVHAVRLDFLGAVFGLISEGRRVAIHQLAANGVGKRFVLDVSTFNCRR
jgi:hypothetical protein